MKRIYTQIVITALAGALFVTQNTMVKADNNSNNNKMTICHGTGSASNPFVRIVVSSNADGGHFNANGTPRAGHESDILLSGEADCPTVAGAVATPTPTPTPTPSHTPTVTPSPTPTETPTVLGAAATPTSPAPAEQVLGAQAQQGEVLGAEALAPTGVFDQLVSNLLKITGTLVTGLGLLGYAKGRRA